MKNKYRIGLRQTSNAIYIDHVWVLFTSGGFQKRPATAEEARELESLHAGDTDFAGRRFVDLNTQLQPT